MNSILGFILSYLGVFLGLSHQDCLGSYLEQLQASKELYVWCEDSIYELLRQKVRVTTEKAHNGQSCSLKLVVLIDQPLKDRGNFYFMGSFALILHITENYSVINN